MFRDGQKLHGLRQEEANLIAEICGSQVLEARSLARFPRGHTDSSLRVDRGRCREGVSCLATYRVDGLSLL